MVSKGEIITALIAMIGFILGRFSMAVQYAVAASIKKKPHLTEKECPALGTKKEAGV